MKPITLMIAGLHSFRQKQFIDFETLCDGGVFGIFGPTGSGKSSILDAMTLALYGKVERATNNTQGIMNHAENTVEVSFLFELESANGKKRYKVERTFKRTDDVRVKSGISRLSEEKDGEHFVLADKANDVNMAIQDIIGLTIDDFTRAVVLPQGKFAEFLSLKGADRRQMLQRLFQLEKYGDRLSKRIKEELQEKTMRLSELEAEQLGLGEASDEAVKEAENVFQELHELVIKAEKSLTVLESDFEEKKKLWEWQEERKPIEKKLSEIKEDETYMKQLQERLTQTEQAEGLKPFLEDLKEAKQTLLHWQNKQEQDLLAWESAQKVLEKTTESYQLARENKEKEIPVLLSKKENLERAKKLQEGLTSYLTQWKDKQEAIERKIMELAKVKAEEKRTSELFIKAGNKQKLLKEELSEKTQSPEYLELLQKAFDEKQQVMQLEDKISETTKEVQKLHEKFSDFHKEKEKASMNGKKEKENLLHLFNILEKYYDRSMELGFYLDRLEKKSSNILEQERVLADNLKVHQLALELARALEKGKACPVCGSTEHPGFASNEGHNEVATSKESDDIEKILSAIQLQRQENMKVNLKLEQIASEFFQNLEGNYQLPAPTELHEKADLWTKEMDQAHDVTEFLIEKFNGLVTEQKGLWQDLLELQEKKKSLDFALRHWTSTYQENERLSTNYKEEWQQWNNRLEELTNQLSEKKKRWNDTYPNHNYEQVETAYLAGREKEKQRAELQARINKSVEFLEEKETEQKDIERKITDLEKELYEHNVKKEQLDIHIKEQKEEIYAIVENKNINEMINTVIHTINSINSKEAESYKEWTNAQQLFQDSEKKKTKSEQMVTEFSSRHASLHEKWTIALKKSAFSNVEEVEGHILQISSIGSWKQQVEGFIDKKNTLEKEWERLNRLIGKNVLEESEWSHIQQNLQDNRRKLRENIERRSASYQHLTSIKDRNNRYQFLEEKKTSLKEELQAYQKLQHVFRGNSFVEYLAEEQLHQISRDASERLGQLTRQRYALEMDSQGGFIIRDDANGGVRRPVSSLSGGETFLTSLALALSLSTQIQLRGEYPLQFFFLDEGFGTLDSELLDTVVTALEKLQSNHLAVGVISHVQELRARLSKRLIVTPAESSGKGSLVTLDSY
ncbi:AAA family ATPase [Sutcliffiella rhizosphaerae]|uniref:Nuclease SbcCD subunit C n=1 Tax=Sutcliffiella rhizosphaerae TaxID=2880967 RepID=A0ABM8YU08_9BACI|nr:SMC family ATPase [Sutcliffiella rhizosphaerae]CAG9623457.1 hypothetical protein BACCIP111883_04270 [Sutcliffiella rhizosphaerae]